MRRGSIPCFAIAALTVLVPPVYGRDTGLIVSLKSLQPGQRAILVQEIQKARETKPEVFEALDRMVASYPDQYPRDHAGEVRLLPGLKALGPDALFPMLELLVVRGSKAFDLGEDDLLRLRVDLTHAVGLLRDPKSLGTLEAIVRGEAVDRAIRVVAAVAIGRFRSDEALEILRRIANDEKVTGDSKAAAFAGLGKCKRELAAKRLSDEIHTLPNLEIAMVVVKALGDVGAASIRNSKLGQDRDKEDDRTRSLAVDALFWSFIHYENDVLRNEASVAIFKIRHESTYDRIVALRQGTDPQIVKALDELERGYGLFLSTFTDR